MNNDYTMPEFLKAECDEKVFRKWLDRKSKSLYKRDRKRWNTKFSREEYKQELYRAIIESKGIDYYTGRKLNWGLIGKYNNDESKKRGSEYKAELAELPTADHVDIKSKSLELKICSWKVNDAKNDLSYNEFVKLCREIVEFAEKKK